MKIKILGTGCPNCQKLEKNIRQALAESKIDAEVEKITDIEKIMSYGVMSLPGIVIDEKVLSYGKISSVEEVKKLLTENKIDSSDSSGHCSCNGNC